MNKGHVAIVGAGPGDPGLLTLKAVQILRKSNVVIYDQLVHPGFLSLVSADCLLIYAGKQFGRKSITQTQINQLMVRYALQGRQICRLKGGDVMIFGRVTEEIQCLKSQGISFEIVPGITAATGASAYTGIPLTDRTHASSVAFVTAHKASKESHQNSSLPKIIRTVDTVVVYMGTSDFAYLKKFLLSSKVPKKTRVTAVMWATWGIQTKCVSTLNEMDRDFLTAKISAPAVLIFGEVNQRSEEFKWFENKSLFGKRIIITRSLTRNRAFVDQLISEGADIVELPTIHIAKPDSYSDLDDAIKKIQYYDWVVFTSANSASALLNRLTSETDLDMRTLSHLKIAAVGKSTAQHLRSYGIKPDLIPQDYTGQAMAQAMKNVVKDGKLKSRVLMVRSDIALGGINHELSNQGFEVDQVTGYKTVYSPREIKLKFERMQQHPVHGIVFTSSSTAHNFIKAIGIKKSKLFLSNIDVFSIGPITSQTLSSYGITAIHEANEHTMNGIATSIRNVYAKDYV